MATTMPQILTTHRRLYAAALNSLDLVKREYRDSDTSEVPINGLCYAMAEAMYHLHPGTFTPHRIGWDDGASHWFLRLKDGTVFEPLGVDGELIEDQDTYDDGRPRPFRTPLASKRAVELIRRAGLSLPTAAAMKAGSTPVRARASEAATGDAGPVPRAASGKPRAEQARPGARLRARPSSAAAASPPPAALARPAPARDARTVWRLTAHHDNPDAALRWIFDHSRIAIGWGKIGSLRQPSLATPKDITAAIAETYPRLSNAVPGGRVLHDLRDEVAVGDWVLIRAGRGLHLVEVTGEYEFRGPKDSHDDYFHQRPARRISGNPKKVWEAAGAAAEPGASIRWTLIRCARRLPRDFAPQG